MTVCYCPLLCKLPTALALPALVPETRSSAAVLGRPCAWANRLCFSTYWPTRSAALSPLSCFHVRSYSTRHQTLYLTKLTRKVSTIPKTVNRCQWFLVSTTAVAWRGIRDSTRIFIISRLLYPSGHAWLSTKRSPSESSSILRTVVAKPKRSFITWSLVRHPRMSTFKPFSQT